MMSKNKLKESQKVQMDESSSYYVEFESKIEEL